MPRNKQATPASSPLQQAAFRDSARKSSDSARFQAKCTGRGGKSPRVQRSGPKKRLVYSSDDPDLSHRKSDSDDDHDTDDGDIPANLTNALAVTRDRQESEGGDWTDVSDDEPRLEESEPDQDVTGRAVPEAQRDDDQRSEASNASSDGSLDSPPTKESLARLCALFSEEISSAAKKEIIAQGPAVSNSWLMAIISHTNGIDDSDGNDASDEERGGRRRRKQQTPLAVNSYHCLILYKHTREHGDFSHLALQKYAPQALDTYLAAINRLGLPRPHAKPKELWYIEGHRLQFSAFAAGQDTSDGSEDSDESISEEGGRSSSKKQKAAKGTKKKAMKKEWYVEMQIVYNDGSKEWIWEGALQEKHPTAVLTYWASSQEGVDGWLDFNDDYRVLADGTGKQRKVAHRLCKILGHRVTPPADTLNGGDGDKTKPAKKGIAVSKKKASPQALGKRKRSAAALAREEALGWTFWCQWAGFPAGKWATTEQGDKVKESHAQVYNQYVKRVLAKS